MDIPKNVEDFKDALANAIGLNHRKHGGIWAFIREIVYGHEPLPGSFYTNLRFNLGVCLSENMLIGIEKKTTKPL